VPHFHYGGNAPRTNGALTAFDVHLLRSLAYPRKMLALVDATNTGLALYTSGQFPQNVFEIFRQLPIVVGYLPLSLTCYLRQF
jgi:hypothetical protein